ncbi:hypothetical protein [Synechococcus sp. UW140]|uniref:hypothetical protein n=1 Tax=Synechococcus sp. UW140 TaxID=368503 RepID=UPI000E0EEAA2|nr:hypothetical protein [Synechococcus sp. UW140]
MSNHTEQVQSCKDYIERKYSRTTPFPIDWEADEVLNCINHQEPNNEKRAADLPTFVMAGVMRQFQADKQLEMT